MLAIISAVNSKIENQRQQRFVSTVDLGRRDIAVTSDGDSWSGQDIEQVRDRFSRVRASPKRKPRNA